MTAIIRMATAGDLQTFHDIMVSAEDEARVREHTFRVFVNKNQNGRLTVKGTKDFVTLSHFLIGKPPALHVVDHLDNDPRNNCRENLRFATYSQNGQNRQLQPNQSGYLGVSFRGPGWAARCNTRHLGTFSEATAAARCYDAYAFRTYGPHAKRNFPEEPVEEWSTPQKKARKEELPVGVTRIRESSRFVAAFQRKCIGTFDTIADASAAYQAALEAKVVADKAALLSVPLDYDINGLAIIPICKGGELAAYMKCDPEDWHELLSRNVNLTLDGYAQTRRANSTILVHRLLLQAAPGSTVDHINRDRLDNRRANLRFVTPRENLQNSRRGK